jgi:hypothetical protein
MHVLCNTKLQHYDHLTRGGGTTVRAAPASQSVRFHMHVVHIIDSTQHARRMVPLPACFMLWYLVQYPEGLVVGNIGNKGMLQ